MNKNIILMTVFVSFVGSVDVQASQSDDLGLTMKYLKSTSRLRSQSRNDGEVVGITTAHTSAESLSDYPSRSYSRNTYNDADYRKSPMVSSAFHSIENNPNSAIAKKVIESSPSLDVANSLVDEMIFAVKSNSPFIKKSQEFLNNGSPKHALKALIKDGLHVANDLPSEVSDLYINELALNIRGLKSLNAYHQKEGLLSDKQKQLIDLCNQREFIETCVGVKESLNR